MIPCSSTIMLGELKEIQFNEGVAKIIFDAMSASEMPVFRLQWSESSINTCLLLFYSVITIIKILDSQAGPVHNS